jgi:hypothetical protein
MPFTVSHIAAVLPGYRPLTRAHVFTAAVIGSMVPDFGLLVPGFMARWQTHSLSGLFTFCLPVGLTAYWLTLLLIRPAVIEVAPDGAYVRLRAADPPASIRQPRTWLYAAAALLLGAATHLIWDAFTHENARGVRMIPFLTDYGPEMAGHALHLYRWLQYGSSVLGLVVVGAALGLWVCHAAAPSTPSCSFSCPPPLLPRIRRSAASRGLSVWSGWLPTCCPRSWSWPGCWCGRGHPASRRWRAGIRSVLSPWSECAARRRRCCWSVC